MPPIPIRLSRAAGENLVWKQQWPESYAGPILPQAEIYSLSDKVGELLVQQWENSRWMIRYFFFRFVKKVMVQEQFGNPGLWVRLMHEGSFSYRFSGYGKVRLKEKRYSAFYAAQAESLGYYDRNRDYQVLDLFFDSQMLQPLLELYPSLEKFLRPAAQGKVNLLAPAMESSTGLWQQVNQLFNGSYTENAARLYGEETMTALLLQIVQELLEQPEPDIKFSPAEMDAIYAVRQIIEQDLKNHSSIGALARQAGINEFKLKRGFRQFFQMGIFDCLVMARMEKAKELLLDTDLPVKSIALEVGYRRLTSFVTAFRKCFGQSPGRLRKQSRA